MCVVAAMAVGFAGCVGTSVPTDTARDDSERAECPDFTYSNVRIDKLFGLNDKVLSDTNLFSAVGNNWHHYELKLEDDGSGFTSCTLHLERDEKTRQLRLEYANLERRLALDSDDDDLLREYRKTIGWLNDRLGTDIEIESLVDWRQSRLRNEARDNRCALTLCHTCVRANLADGQEVLVKAQDAVFMRRDGEYIEMAPAAVEVTIRMMDRGMPLLGPLVALDRTDCEAKELTPAEIHGVAIGCDLSAKLSKAVRDRERERPRKVRRVNGK